MSVSEIVGAILIAVVGGFAGAYIKPLAEHRFEELKIREKQRRELISTWRNKIYQAHATQSAWIAGDTRVDNPPEDLYGQPWYENFRSYLTDQKGSIEHVDISVRQILEDRHALMTDQNMRLLSDEVSRLSREWKISAKGRRRPLGLWW